MLERRQGKVALVTGASSGIGAAFSRQLAAVGYDLVLVARRQERLALLAGELEACYGVAVESLAADLSEPTGMEAAEKRVQSLDELELLINNAGFGTRGDFVEAELSRQLKMIQLHVLASVRLSRAALPGMIGRGRGGIINVASLGAFVALPGDATYGATKAYLVSFSRALHEELRGTGVCVQALCPGFTRTEFHTVEQLAESDLARIPGVLWSQADEVVAESLRALARGQVVCVPGWRNRLVLALARVGVLDLLLRVAL
jgi:short-subunit dehydrogenase